MDMHHVKWKTWAKTLRNYTLYAIVLGSMMLLAPQTVQSQPPRILIFTKTAGFRHTSIEKGAEAIQLLCQRKGWVAVHTEDATVFNKKKLHTYQTIIFLHTTGDILDEKQEKAFEAYIRNGGGFIGIHAASDTEYEWPWYGNLVGGYFNGHPAIQEASFILTHPESPLASGIPSSFKKTDEFYNFNSLYSKLQVLITIDESTYEGGTHGSFHPFTWYHEYDGGRSFYTGFGHTEETFSERLFLTLLENALVWTMKL